ncbi:MAG: class II aldolase/adducin family protein [Aquificaceae bacterium]
MEKIALKKLMEIGRLLYKEGLVDARAGNLSYRLEEDMVITRRGSHLGRLREEDFIKVSISKSHILEDRASSELPVHREVYLRASHRCLIHAHPICAVVLSFEKDLITPIDSEGKDLIGSVKVIDSCPSGSIELARAVAEALVGSKLVIVRSHGVFSADLEPFYAYSHISVLERSCKILLYESNKIQRL